MTEQSKMTTNFHGVKMWRLSNGSLHRLDGPAVVGPNGARSWYVNGLRHREDGPAIDRAEGKSWWINGELHRLDGPAVKWANGTKEWHINGKFIYREYPND